MEQVNLKRWYGKLSPMEKDQVRIDLKNKLGKTTDCVKAKIMGMRHWTWLEWKTVVQYFEFNWEVTPTADNIKTD